MSSFFLKQRFAKGSPSPGKNMLLPVVMVHLGFLVAVGLAEVLRGVSHDHEAQRDDVVGQAEDTADGGHTVFHGMEPAPHAADAEGASGPPGEDTGDAPYEVDYTLPMRDRYVAVKNYYLGYDDIAQALEDYLEDETAQAYLGDYYDYLLQLLLLMQE